MPPLKEMLGAKPTGFAAMEMPKTPPPAEIPGRALAANPYRRCPLPPFSATVDTMRQFDESGKIPTRRVIPLPVQVSGQGTSITNVTQVTNSTSGGGSSGGGTTLASATVSLAVPALSPGQSYTATLTMAKSFQPLLLTSTNPVEVRMYGTAVSQAGDGPRATDTAPPFEVTVGLFTDIVFDTAPYQWTWQNRIAANGDSPQSKNIYVTVINPTESGLTPTNITITYLPLES